MFSQIVIGTLVFLYCAGAISLAYLAGVIGLENVLSLSTPMPSKVWVNTSPSVAPLQIGKYRWFDRFWFIPAILLWPFTVPLFFKVRNITCGDGLYLGSVLKVWLWDDTPISPDGEVHNWGLPCERPATLIVTVFGFGLCFYNRRDCDGNFVLDFDNGKSIKGMGVTFGFFNVVPSADKPTEFLTHTA